MNPLSVEHRKVIISLLTLIFSLISQLYLKVNFMPALTILLLLIAGSLNNNKSILISILLVFVLFAFNEEGDFSMVYWMKSAFAIIPLLIGLFISQKIKNSLSVFYAIIIFIIPFALFSGFEDITYRFMVSSISYGFSHFLYFAGVKAKDKTYFLSFSFLLLILIIEQIIGYYLNALAYPLGFSILWMLINFVILILMYSKIVHYKINFLRGTLNVLIISSLIAYCVMRFNSIPEPRERQNIVFLSHDIQEINLYTKGKISEIQLTDEKVQLNFWATWCGPCIRKLNSLEEIEENEYFVSFEDSLVVDKFIRKKNYNFPIYYIPKSDLKNIASEIHVFPSNALMNKDSVKITKGEY